MEFLHFQNFLPGFSTELETYILMVELHPHIDRPFPTSFIEEDLLPPIPRCWWTTMKEMAEEHEAENMKGMTDND